MDGPRKEIMEKLKGQTRLPRLAAPKRYDLTLKPDLVTCTFSGSVCIDIYILEATSVLVLNALDLSIQEAWYSSSTGLKYQPSDVVMDGEDEILVLVFDDVLGAGDGVLVIKFSGVLDDSMMGFYRGTYMDGGVKKNMATTQFEAVDARRCFPCWDEPALKSYFKVTLIVPSELVALSNMPVIKEEIQENFKTVHFEESPLMSTYLVAFVVGSFDYIEDKTSDGTEVRVYSPVGRSDEGRFALTLAVRSLDFFGKFFSMPYPLPKLDMVGVPDFSTGAMENYGLIIYRDVLLLQNDDDCTAANKQTLAIVVAHEVAHQWFGNFVTMEWWTHLWLNEGFATWISYLAVENFFPEWKIWTQFCEVTTGGLLLDSLEQSHPIEVEVGHAHSVNELLDDIAYKKGSSVIRMLQDYLGDEIFQRGLSSYIKKFACKNAKTNDLWEVLSEEAGSEVNRMMDTWTKKKGYPVVSVRLQGHNLEFEQSQFLSSGLQASGEWMIPISFSVGSYTRQRKFLLERKCSSEDISDLLNFTGRNLSSDQINIQDESDSELWVKVNIDQTGFYRVKYEDKLSSRLRRAIQNNSLSGIDKFGILDDACALCEACEVSLSSLLSLMAVYKEEQDHTVLSRLIDACENIVKVCGDAVPHMVDQLKQFIINILLNPAEKLGWDPKPEETHSDALLRGQVLVALVSLDHGRTQEEAMNRFKAFLEDRHTPLLPADTRKAAYVAAMRNSSTSNRKGFESLLDVYRHSEAIQERTRVLRTLASSRDPDIVCEVLNMLFSDEVREQDVIYVLWGISPEGREVAWRWLKDNWGGVLDKWGCGRGMLLTHFIREIIQLSSNEMVQEVEEFFASRPNPTIEQTLKQSIERVRIKARWVEHIRQEDMALFIPILGELGLPTH